MAVSQVGWQAARRGRNDRVGGGRPCDFPVVAFGIGEVGVAALEELGIGGSLVKVPPAARARLASSSTSPGRSTVMMTALRIPALIGSRACVARQLVELEQRQHSTAALADREVSEAREN